MHTNQPFNNDGAPSGKNPQRVLDTIRLETESIMLDGFRSEIGNYTEYQKDAATNSANIALSSALEPFEAKFKALGEKHATHSLPERIVNALIRRLAIERPALLLRPDIITEIKEFAAKVETFTKSPKDYSSKAGWAKVQEAVKKNTLRELMFEEVTKGNIIFTTAAASLAISQQHFVTYTLLRDDYSSALKDFCDKPVIFECSSGHWYEKSKLKPSKEFEEGLCQLASQGFFREGILRRCVCSKLNSDYEIHPSLKDKMLFSTPVLHGDIYLGALVHIAKAKDNVEITPQMTKDSKLIAGTCAEALAHLEKAKATSNDYL